MKVLVALPVKHGRYTSIDAVIEGDAPCSGTDGSIIRLASFLAETGVEVCLSAAERMNSTKFSCIQHDLVESDRFDRLIVHQSHWTGTSLTFGNHVLAKTYLWLQNHLHQTMIFTFLQEGGCKVICPSQHHADIYRPLPGWRKKVEVVYNSYCKVFRPTPPDTPKKEAKPRLLFVGAITPEKGFIELTQIWSYLADRQVDLELAIAGSISLHSPDVTVGDRGVAESNFESSAIQPWLNSLPKDYQPKFLGSLSPRQLQPEIANSWAVIVNPAYRVPETFCVAAVDAQACSRTVFSVCCGALPETVYQGRFNSLAKGNPVNSVGDCIIQGLLERDLVIENGKLASQFVSQKFDRQLICKTWIDLLTDRKISPGFSKFWNSPRNFICDLMRWTRTWKLVNDCRNKEHRQIMSTYQKFKAKNNYKLTSQS